MVTAPVPTEADRQVDLQQQKIDELNRQVAQLQGDLASALAKSEETNRQTPEALPVPAVATEIVKPSAIPATKPPRKAPMLNIPGVTVTTDAERDEIRFGIVDSVLFVPGTHRISPEAEQVLRRIVAEIRTIGPDQSLEIEGHTDSLNVDPANPTQKHDISTIKSVAVMEYFVKSLLWKPEKIRTSAHGATQPLSDNGTPEGRRQNNRVEIVVLP